MSINSTILLIENEDESAKEIQRFLKLNDSALSISHVTNVTQASLAIGQQSPAVVLLSTSLLGDRSTALLQQVKANGIPLILLSENGGDELEQLSFKAGAVEAVVKNKINYFLLQKTIEGLIRLSSTVSSSKQPEITPATHSDDFNSLFQKLAEGVLVINSADQIAFANQVAYGVMAETDIREQLAEILHFRKTGDANMQLKAGADTVIHIRQSSIQWRNEPATLFLLERKAIAPASDVLLLNDEVLYPVIHSLNESIFILKEQHVLLANKHALDALKLSPLQLKGLLLSDILLDSNTEKGVIPLADFFDVKEQLGEVRLSDGASRPVKYLIRPLSISGNYYRLFSFSFVENKAEHAVPQGAGQTDTLSNDNVLYLASHDLREPVRTILNYLQLVADKINAQKYEEATEFAGYAKNAASGMDRLLSDLKVYTALGTHVFSPAKFSMKQAVADVVKQLKVATESAEAEISFADLPDVIADRQLVEKLLFHLVDNAIKFSRKDKKPVIDIGYDRFEGSTIFCVRDNGIGISKKHYQKIFEMFERLNRSEQYLGNGLGLAICKKITDIHGGEIWVESLPGSGSNFYFTLGSHKV